VTSRQPSAHLILGLGFAVAAAYALGGLAAGMLGHDTAVGVTLAVTGLLIAGPLAIVSRALMNRPRGDGPPETDGQGDGPGPDGGGDGDGDPAPWWPDFERDLRAHIEKRERDREPTPA
jgi:hypothetical protein